MGRFEIDNFWEDSMSPVYGEFQAFSRELKKRIAKRMKFFEQQTIGTLLKTEDLKKITGYRHTLYELRFHTNPPVRMLGTIIGTCYRPLRLFQKKRQKIPPREIETALQRVYQ